VETSAGTRVADALVGRLVDGRYLVERRLARGGMATVYEATDQRLDRTVALKIMHPGLAEDAAFVSRFQREAKSAARLTDPHVVAVFDQGEDDGAVYLVMEYVAGRTLRQVLREQGRLSAEQALTVLDPVLQALDAAHRAGFVHRDVKPENVLIADDGRVKVADFGLARAISAATSTAATQGMLIGTVAYLSPEQVERGIADERSDVYGAGILLYEMVTGSVPFAGETPLAVAYQHVNAAVPAPSSVRSGISPLVDAVVAKATARDADERYSSAAEFLADARAVRTDLPAPRPFGDADGHATLVVPVPGAAPTGSASTGPGAGVGAAGSPPPARPTPARRRRRGWIPLVALLVVAALVAGGAWALGAARVVAVPAVVGLTPEAAAEKLTAVALTLDASGTAFSETVKAGTIISTDPEPGAEVREGSTVAAVVSRGPERYAVPAVSGSTLAQARQAITDANLAVGEVTTAFNEKIPVDQVVGTDPKAGTKLKRDQAVGIVVSKGPAPVKIPDLAGSTKAAATAALTKRGLEVTATEEFSKTVAAGRVITSTPKPGTTAPKGSTVALVVSKGPPPVVVPDLYRIAEDEARATLRGLGLKVSVVYPIGITPFGLVVKQSAKAGSTVPWGSTVTIEVV
jgi:serine/threonine-protein kinase